MISHWLLFTNSLKSSYPLLTLYSVCVTNSWVRIVLGKQRIFIFAGIRSEQSVMVGRESLRQSDHSISLSDQSETRSVARSLSCHTLGQESNSGAGSVYQRAREDPRANTDRARSSDTMGTVLPPSNSHPSYWAPGQSLRWDYWIEAEAAIERKTLLE